MLKKVNEQLNSEVHDLIDDLKMFERLQRNTEFFFSFVNISPNPEDLLYDAISENKSLYG